jgi:hypothetical protein
MNRLPTLAVVVCLALTGWAQNLDAPTALKMGQTGADTFVGIISDSSCGARHKMMDKSAEECARTCQRAGAKYVLVAGETVYGLRGRTNEVAYLAGQKAKITGSLHGNTIAVKAAGPIR